MEERKYNGGELAARMLSRAGVEVVFALHGGHLDSFLTGCVAEGIRLVDCRHEAAAVNAADGYARLTGRLGVAAVTSGPGLTNGLAGITNAAADSIPILVVTSSSPTRETETLELQGGLDLISMLTPVTKWANKVLAAQRTPDIVGLAIRKALTPPHGPTVVDIPIDVAFTPVDPDSLPRSGDPSVAELPQASPDAIEAAARLLEEADRPVAIVGEAGLMSGPLLRFAEQASVPVFKAGSTPSGLPASHPMNGGGTHTLGFIDETPDLVILVGARQGMYTGGRSGTLIAADTRVIQLHPDAAEMGRLYPVDAAVVGDCSASLDAMAGARNWVARKEWCTKAVSGRSAIDQLFSDADMEADGIHPYRLAKALGEGIGPDTIVILDGGEAAAWARWALEISDVETVLGLGYQGHLGVGQGWAIGAQVAHPDKRIIQVAGDGAIGFHIQEWDTMFRHELPIVTIVFNNACWGMSIHGQQAVYGEDGDVISRLAPTRYDLVAQGFGAHGELVESADGIAPAIRRALDADRPAVINVLTSASVVHPVTIGLLGDLNAEDEIVVPYYQNIPRR